MDPSDLDDLDDVSGSDLDDSDGVSEPDPPKDPDEVVDVAEEHPEDLEGELEDPLDASDTDASDLDATQSELDLEDAPQQVIVSSRRMTLYEWAALVACRAELLRDGAPSVLRELFGDVSVTDLALRELEQGVMPLSVVRVAPNGQVEVISAANLRRSKL